MLPRKKKTDFIKRIKNCKIKKGWKKQEGKKRQKECDAKSVQTRGSMTLERNLVKKEDILNDDL